LGHALEIATRFELTHGESVAIGLVYAAELACRLGRISPARVAEHRATVGAYDLPMNIPSGIGIDDLLPLFARDKKATHGVTFVLDGPNGVEPVAGIDERHLRDALEAVR
jgi:5-deoxy-5-amino-3-dehydroquinate synthase